MAKAKRKTQTVEAIAPTPEQAGRDEYKLERAPSGGQVGGAYYRKVRQLEKLTDQGLFTPSQARHLHNYRTWADMSDRSPLKDSLNKMIARGGASDGPTVALLNAIRQAGACEAAAGSLAHLLRSVIVNDVSLATYAMLEYGKKLDCKLIGDRRVCYDRPTEQAMKFAKLDMQFLAIRIESEAVA